MNNWSQTSSYTQGHPISGFGSRFDRTGYAALWYIRLYNLIRIANFGKIAVSQQTNFSNIRSRQTEVTKVWELLVNEGPTTQHNGTQYINSYHGCLGKSTLASTLRIIFGQLYMFKLKTGASI